MSRQSGDGGEKSREESAPSKPRRVESAQALHTTISPAEIDAIRDVFDGRGEMRRLFRAIDWTTTSLGPVEGWPPELCTAIGMTLGSASPAVLLWGPDIVVFYNDASIPIFGPRHPVAAGRPLAVGWPDIVEQMKKIVDAVRTTGEPVKFDDLPVPVAVDGRFEERYFTASYCAVPTERGIGGVFEPYVETTEVVLARRRTATLAALAAVPVATTRNHAFTSIVDVLGKNPHDLPFVLAYAIDDAQGRAQLKAAAGIDERSALAPAVIEPASPRAVWPLTQVLESRAPLVVSDLLARFGERVWGPWDEPTREAILLPLGGLGDAPSSGVLVVGLNSRRPLDGPYREFLELVGSQVSAAIISADAFEASRERTNALAELDRAKTVFFSDVSHEFRTPLTLLLGPLEEALANPGHDHRAELEVAHRNALRLQRLVNSLLDFARIEAGRIEAVYEPTDLASLTADLASVFRSAVERAGLRMRVDCPPLPEPVYVDRELWEKIVLNLLSNAFKFTFDGEIAVSLRRRDGHVALTVRDTGVGIPEEELPRVFERFHRVRDTRARTFEGSGIGLALVQELVRLHGGSIRVASSVEDEGAGEEHGTTFTVSIPTGSAHLPAERLDAARTLNPTATGPAPFVAEALRWLPGVPPITEHLQTGQHDGAPDLGVFGADREARVLVADDNADMRDHLARLLGRHWTVETVADGEAALSRARQDPPDLVLADVMMPGLDGFGLLRELRADPDLLRTPIVLVSARAGEESRVEGMSAGADDYLIKPFSARELVTRVGAHLALARQRRHVEETLRKSEERSAFLLQFSDALRPLDSAAEIQGEATRLLREHLDAGWSYYVEWDEAGARGVVLRCATRDGLPSLVGTHDVSDGPAFLDLLRNGDVVNVSDYASFDPLTAEVRARYTVLGFRSMLVATLVKQGRLVASLIVGDTEVRDWSGYAEALLTEVAERTWAAVERARAEAALRESEARLAHDLEATQVLQDIGNQLIAKPGVNGHFNELCEAARALMRSDCASIQAYDDAGARLKLVAHVGFHPDSAAFWEWVDAGVGSTCGRALATGERVIVPDMDLFEADPPDLEAYRRSAILSVQSTPLVARSGQIVGMMSTHWHRPDVPAEASYRFFDILARLGADFIVRIRAEAALRESEERQAFLVRFSDAVRGLTDPVEVATTACGMLLEQLDVDRAHWSEVDWTTEEFVTLGSVHSPGVSAIEGRLPLAAWEPYIASHREGRTVIVDDTQTDPRTDGAMRAVTARMEIGADLAVPVRAGGRLTSVLAVKRRQPRRWTSEEIALVEAVAGRCWVEVGRARAEAALRNSEEKYRTLFGSVDEGFCFYELITDASGTVIDLRYLDTNPAFEKHMGFRPLPGQTARELVPGLEDSWFELNAGVARTGQSQRFENFATELQKWFEVSVVPLPTHDGKLAGIFADITDRKLREQQKNYLLKLSDALRPLADPVQIKLEASRVLGEELGVNRALYAEVMGEDWWAERGYVRDVDPLPTGAYSSDTYGRWLMEMYRRGESLVLEDVRADSRYTAQQRAAAESASIIGAVAVPLVKSGNLVALLSVHTAQPRKWTAHDITIIEETAERTWAAVERARAEAALRAGKERQAFLLELTDAVTPLREASEITATASRLLGEHLGVGRAFFAEIAGDDWIVSDAYDDGASSLEPGRYPAAEYGRWTMDTLRAGGVVAVADTATDARLERSERQALQRIGNAAVVGVPLVRHGDVVAVLSLHSGEPRAWTSAELELVQEVADRTWPWVERARAEEAQRESEQRLQQFGEASTDVLWIRDVETLRWTYLSPAFEEIYGRARESVLGPDDLHSWLDLIVPEDRPLALGMVERVRAGERVTFEYRIQRPDGMVRWLRNTDFPIRDADDVVRHFGGTGRDVTAEKQAEAALRDSEERLRRLNEQLEDRVHERTSEVRALFQRLVSAQEEERRRIARDIHDQIGQQMTALRMNLEALRSQAAGRTALVEQAERTQRLAEELDQSIDFITWQLRPAALDHLGLSAALRNLVTGWSERFGVEAAFDVAGVEDVRMPRDVEANLYRVAQEALHNIAKHAEATHVTVFVTQQDGEVVLVVEDNGRGFDPATKRESVDSTGLGLASMRERAALMGGRLEIESTTGLGTTIYVRLPEPNGTNEHQ